MPHKETDDYLFTTTDPEGRKISLKKSTFADHIITSHQEISPLIIKHCIENPHLSHQDKNHENRINYRRLLKEYPDPKAHHMTTIKTVVEKTVEGYEIVTAHLISDLKNEIAKGGFIYDSTDKSDK